MPGQTWSSPGSLTRTSAHLPAMTNNLEGSMSTVADIDEAPEVIEAEKAARAVAQAQADYAHLVKDRLWTYQTFSGRDRDLDDPRFSPDEREQIARRTRFAKRLTAMPTSIAIGVSTAAATVPFLDFWALPLMSATVIGSLVAGARMHNAQPKVVHSIDEGTHLALADFRKAEGALLELNADPKTVGSVQWLTQRVDEAVLVLTASDPDLSSATVSHAARVVQANEDLREVAARAWALVQLEERRHTAVEAALTPVIDALEVAAEDETLDFSEIDAVATAVGVETADIAADMDVDLPALAPRVTKTIDVTDPKHQTCRLCGAPGIDFSNGSALCRDCGVEFALTTPWDITPFHRMVQRQAETFEPGDPRANMCGTCLGHGHFAQQAAKGTCKHCDGTGYRPGTPEHRDIAATHAALDAVRLDRHNRWRPGTNSDDYDDEF